MRDRQTDTQRTGEGRGMISCTCDYKIQQECPEQKTISKSLSTIL